MINQPEELIELFRKEYICPISGHPIQKPVVDVDGYSFESEDIQNHFSLSSISPVTGNQITSKVLTENVMLQNLIQRVQSEIPKISLQILSLKGQIRRLQLQNERITHQNEHYFDGESNSQKKESQQKVQVSDEILQKRKSIRKKQSFKRYYVGQVGKLFQKKSRQMERIKQQLQQGYNRQLQKIKMDKFRKQRQLILLGDQLRQKDDMIRELERKLSVTSIRFENKISQYEELIVELVIHQFREKSQCLTINDTFPNISISQQSHSSQDTFTINQHLLQTILSRYGIDINSPQKLQTRQQLISKLHHLNTLYLDANNKLELNNNHLDQQLFQLKSQLRKTKQEVVVIKKNHLEERRQVERGEELRRREVGILQQHLTKMHSSWMLIVYAIEEFSSLSKQYHEESLTSKILSMINQIKEEISNEIFTERQNLQHIFHFTIQTMKKIKSLYKIQSYCEIWDFIDLYSCCYSYETTNPQQSSGSISYSLDFQSLVKIFDRSLAKGIQWTDILQLRSESMAINDESWRTFIKNANLFKNLVSINLENNSIKNLFSLDFQNFPNLQKINLKHDKSIPWSFDSIQSIRNYKNEHKHVKIIY